jgi:hypothetical protein
MKLSPGEIVNIRKRLWRIDHADDRELIASPIDSDSQHRTSFLWDIEDIQPANLAKISAETPGNFAFQQLLLRAYRFDLLHGSAPFLILQRSSVIPINYQLVPLVLSLEKAKTR